MRKGGAVTLAASVQELLGQEILSGSLRPGEQLRPAEIGARHGVSVTVVREALTRLSAQSLVTARHGAGFQVTALNRQELTDLTKVRILFEPHALELAVERGDVIWESKILAAHHRMVSARRGPTEIRAEATDAFVHEHTLFHETLLAACDVPLLMTIFHSLWNAAALYRRWAAASSLSHARNSAAEHQAILAACLDHKPKEAGALLAEHIHHTTELLLQSDLLSETGTERG